MILKSSNQETSYRDVLKDDESLAVFLRNMAEFDEAFCRKMAGGRDFTLKLEVRGNLGELIHCRVCEDHFDRPPEANKRVNRRQQGVGGVGD